MPWYKNKQAFLVALVLTLAFLLEGFLFSGFFNISNTEKLTSLQIFAMLTCSATTLFVTNSLTLIFLVNIAKLMKGQLESFSNKVGVINFSILFLIVPLFFSTLLWSLASKWIITILGGVVSMSNSTVLVLFILNVVIFFTAVLNTTKFTKKEADSDSLSQ